MRGTWHSAIQLQAPPARIVIKRNSGKDGGIYRRSLCRGRPFIWMKTESSNLKALQLPAHFSADALRRDHSATELGLGPLF